MPTIKVDASEALRVVNDVHKRQIPFATAKAINAVTVAGQRVVQTGLSQHFILRRGPFIERTVKMLQFAKKDGTPAILGIDPQRDFLAKFEHGGQKRPIRGQHLAVPILRASNPRKVITASDPLALKNLQLVGGKGQRGTFTVRAKDGTVVVLQRMQRKRKGNKGRDPYLKVLYAFKKSVPIAPDLNLERTVRRVVSERWTEEMARALSHAIATAR